MIGIAMPSGGPRKSAVLTFEDEAELQVFEEALVNTRDKLYETRHELHNCLFTRPSKLVKVLDKLIQRLGEGKHLPDQYGRSITFHAPVEVEAAHVAMWAQQPFMAQSEMLKYLNESVVDLYRELGVDDPYGET